MKMSEVLLIKLDTNGFERFYNRKMQECGCTVLPISDFRREKYGLSVLRPLQLRQLTPRYLAQYRLIVLFEEPALFLYLKKRIDPSRTKLVLWNWNITNRTWLRGNAPLRRRCENWTFDAVDAKKFGWKLNEQFYFAPKALPVRENADGKAGLTAFSACVDKGRYPMMKEMREALRRQGVATDFCLVSEPLRRYAAEDAAWIKTKGLPYEEFLQHTIQSDIVVEVVQSRQVGIPGAGGNVLSQKADHEQRCDPQYPAVSSVQRPYLGAGCAGKTACFFAGGVSAAAGSSGKTLHLCGMAG